MGFLWCVEAREKVARGQYRLMGGRDQSRPLLGRRAIWLRICPTRVLLCSIVPAILDH